MPKISTLYAEHLIAEAYNFEQQANAELLASQPKEAWAALAISFMVSRLASKGEKNINPETIKKTIASVKKHMAAARGNFYRLAQVIESPPYKNPNDEDSSTEVDGDSHI